MGEVTANRSHWCFRFEVKPELDFQSFTLQGIKHIPPGEVWKIIDSKCHFWGDMLVPWRVTNRMSVCTDPWMMVDFFYGACRLGTYMQNMKWGL